ncbi:MAG: D-inositol-3-phosphate glycosyltransferase [Frankiaceae bacterium]|nr:D-inositol-3-phosphate glycosyltransferase [Frankiaceae bacterium]
MNHTTRVLVLDQAVGLWGAQRYLLRLSAPLAEHGVELVLAAPRSLDLSAAWVEAGLPYVDLPLPLVRSVRADGEKGRISPAALAREGRATRDVRRLIADAARREGADVIHANGHAIHLDAALGGRLARLPVVLHLHEEMQQRFGRGIRAAAVALADASVAVSQAVADGVPARLRRSVTVIANGVDTDAIRPGKPDEEVRRSLGAASDDVLLVALTRLDPEKRIEDLIDALAPLASTGGWHLAIAGVTSSYPEYADEVRALAARVLPGRVTFAGRREDVSAVLDASDVLVHAGVIEGMPLGLLEAQAAGRPVVAYSVAGVPEAVRDGVTGLLAPACDVATLGRHMKAFIDDPAMRERFGRAGRAHIEASHTVDGQAAAYAELLQRMTSGSLQRAAVPA